MPYDSPARVAGATPPGPAPDAPVNGSTPASLQRLRSLVEPALLAAVEGIADERMRLISGYQLGLWDADGTPTPGQGGKAVRPTLVLLAAAAASGHPERGLPAAVAVELVHNFSLLHDDIMDRDVQRRHRPTGWVVYGDGQSILAGNALLVAAVQALAAVPQSERCVEVLLGAVQRLISGQSADLALEQSDDADLATVLEMERGKTGALISCALTLGAICGGADDDAVAHLQRAGELVGLGFQLVDDLLGIVGDPLVTGKSDSSDVRAGKRSAPIVAALRAGRPESAQLAELLAHPPLEAPDAVHRAVRLIVDAGGVAQIEQRADQLVADALAELAEAQLPHAAPAAELAELCAFLVRRNH